MPTTVLNVTPTTHEEDDPNIIAAAYQDRSTEGKQRDGCGLLSLECYSILIMILSEKGQQTPDISGIKTTLTDPTYNLRCCELSAKPAPPGLRAPRRSTSGWNTDPDPGGGVGSIGTRSL